MKFHQNQDPEDLSFVVWGQFAWFRVLLSSPVSGSKENGDPPVRKLRYMRGIIFPSLGRGPAPSCLQGMEVMRRNTSFSSTHLRLIKRSVSPLLTMVKLSDALEDVRLPVSNPQNSPWGSPEILTAPPPPAARLGIQAWVRG